MILSVNSFNTLSVSDGIISTQIGVRIKSCIKRDGYINEYRGVVEMCLEHVNWINGVEYELKSSSDLPSNLVVPIQVVDEYISGLDQSIFQGVVGYARMELKCYYYLLKYFSDNTLFGISDINEWECTIC